MLADYVRETKWVADNAPRWERDQRVPQADLERFCSDYILAVLRGAPQRDLSFVHLTVQHINTRGRVHKMTEILRWEFDELPEDGQIIVMTECARRMARDIAARDLVYRADVSFGCKSDGDRLPPQHAPKILS